MPIAYDSSRRALMQPELADSLFRHGAPTGIEALASEAARLAYLRVEESASERARLGAALACAGFGAPTLLSHPGSDGQGYAAQHDDGLALISFRGTQPDRVGDLITDAGIAHRPWDLGAGGVHAGFRTTALGLWPEVEAWLAGPAAARRQLLLCGHSLGAAIATLLAQSAGATDLVTIGSPRVGNAAFVAALVAAPGLTIRRIVNCCDVVTEVPPPLLGFEHAGTAIYIDRDGNAHTDTTPAFIITDRAQARAGYLMEHAFRWGTVLARDLADHAPVNYIRAFWP